MIRGAVGGLPCLIASPTEKAFLAIYRARVDVLITYEYQDSGSLIRMRYRSL